jgi:hypothetical protein
LYCASSAAETPLQTNAWTVLNNGLNDTNTDHRTKAVRDLGEIPHNAKAEDAALTALKDDKPEVRAVAAQALGEMGAKSADAQLRGMNKDPESLGHTGCGVCACPNWATTEDTTCITRCLPGNRRPARA